MTRYPLEPLTALLAANGDSVDIARMLANPQVRGSVTSLMLDRPMQITPVSSHGRVAPTYKSAPSQRVEALTRGLADRRRVDCD